MCIVKVYVSFSGICCFLWIKLVDDIEIVIGIIGIKFGVLLYIDGLI